MFRFGKWQQKPARTGPGPKGYEVYRKVSYSTGFSNEPFVNALRQLSEDAEDSGWAPIPLRSLFMAQVGDLIRDKPNWQEKMKNEEIWKKWMEECRRGEVVTEAMEEYIKDELEYWANRMSEDGIVPGIDDVWKSDSLIPAELKQALKDGGALLENVPESQKDWHPGTDEKVLDLVHPSLFPLMYGISGRVEEPMNFRDPNFLSKYVGGGKPYWDPEIFKNPPGTAGDPLDVDMGPDDESKEEEVDLNHNVGPGNNNNNDDDDEEEEDNSNDDYYGPFSYNAAEDMSNNGRPVPDMYTDGDIFDELVTSTKYCWLPTEFSVSPDNKCEPLGYINNLHPERHAPLYDTISAILGRCIPIWDNVLTSSINSEILRTPHNYGPWRKGTVEELETIPRTQWKYAQREQMVEAITEQYSEDVFLKLEDAAEFDPPVVRSIVKLAEFEKVQVIVKMANIHLTPEKPSYPGGTWHVEGATNENIVATAIYYYDSENVEENKLHFRQAVSIPRYEQSDNAGVKKAYGLSNELNQYHGYITTKEDRVIGFPNTYQHRVSSFNLKDKTKPGHRKILCFFLVDPFKPIQSTTHICPQQREWWAEKLPRARPFVDVPTEIGEMIFSRVNFPLSLELAKKHRQALMKERTRVQHTVHKNFTREFTLCEH